MPAPMSAARAASMHLDEKTFDYVILSMCCRALSAALIATKCNATVQCHYALSGSAPKCKPISSPSPGQYQGMHLKELLLLHLLRHVNTSASYAGRIMTPQCSMWLTWKGSWQSMMAAAALRSGSNKVLAINTSSLGQPACHCRTCCVMCNQS